MKLFVKSPAWALFILMYLGALFMLVPMAFIASSLGRAIMVVFVYQLYIQSLWLVAVGKFLHKKARPDSRDALWMLYLAAYGSVVAAILNVVLVWTNLLPEAYTDLPQNLAALTLLGLLVASGLVSRAFRAIEVERPLSSGTGYDYILSFFFSSVGLWLMQPRINRLYKGKTIDDADEESFWEEEL